MSSRVKKSDNSVQIKSSVMHMHARSLEMESDGWYNKLLYSHNQWPLYISPPYSYNDLSNQYHHKYHQPHHIPDNYPMSLYSLGYHGYQHHHQDTWALDQHLSMAYPYYRFRRHSDSSFRDSISKRKQPLQKSQTYSPISSSDHSSGSRYNFSFIAFLFLLTQNMRRFVVLISKFFQPIHDPNHQLNKMFPDLSVEVLPFL